MVKFYVKQLNLLIRNDVQIRNDKSWCSTYYVEILFRQHIKTKLADSTDMVKFYVKQLNLLIRNDVQIRNDKS